MARNRRETLPSVIVVDGLRLVGAIAAGHHQRSCNVPHDEEMQRGCRQHEAKSGNVRRDHWRQSLSAARVQQDDRRRGADEQALLLFSNGAIVFYDVEVARHESEGLRVAALQSPKARHRVEIRGVAGKMIASKTFESEDRARHNEPTRRGEAFLARQLFQFLRAPVQAPQCDLRTAGGAGDRFGVETTIARVFVFRFARHAHREWRHRRVRAIVWYPLNDREARPAMRAIGEGIIGAPFARI